MKKYTSRATLWFAICTLISFFFIIAGVILIIINFSNDALKIGLILIGCMMSIFFIIGFFAEKSRYLIINENEIILSRGVRKNNFIVFKRTVIEISEIASISSYLRKGDGFLTDDTTFYTIKLKNGTNLTFVLFTYGKDAEKEIIDIIKNKIQ